MAQYIVSARKYRPDSFESLIGQDNIARTLKNSILRGQLAHAYLFCGPRGVGKTSAARIFAKTINCSNPGPDMEPCGECESCVSFREGRSYCIHELDAASNNGVEDIKALMEQVQIPPQVGKYSVYIIDEVHMLTQSAFNAFLKTLEEPPAHAIFILATTEKHKIIPTILSRCQTYDFNRISIPDIVRNLRDIAGKEGVTVDDESLHVIAHKADGAMRDALTIFDQTVAFCGADIKYDDVIRNLGVLDYEYSFRLVDAFLQKDYATALLIFDDILSKGFNALHFISSLGGHLRDLLVSRTGGLDSLLDLPASLRERYRGQASRCSVRFLYDALGVVSQCEAGYRASTNQRLHIEFALMRMAFLGGVPESQVVAPAPAQAPVAAAATPAPAPARAPVAAAATPAPAPVAVAATPVEAKAPAVAPAAHTGIKNPGNDPVSAPVAPAGINNPGNDPVSVSAAPTGIKNPGNDPVSVSAAPTGIKNPENDPVSAPVAPAGINNPGNDPARVAPATAQPAAPPAPAPAPAAPKSAPPAPASVISTGAERSGEIPAGKEISRQARDDKGKPFPKPAKRASGLSLAALMSDEEITVELAPEAAAGQEAPLPDADTVTARWAELAASYTAQPRLSGALATARLGISEEDGVLKVSFALVSKAQCDWIAEKKLRELEDRFSRLLSCNRLRLIPEVLPEEQQDKKVFMPVEKAKDLMSRNPEVAELVKDLALDIR